MINVVLDTNILHQEMKGVAKFKGLKRLIDSGEVKIFLPSITKSEFITKRSLEIEDNLDIALKKLNDTRKLTNQNGEMAENIGAHIETISAIKVKAGEVVHEEFSDWERDFNVEVIEFSPESLQSVFDDYFTGSGAFSSVKARKDFPDSFIQKTILSAKENIGQLCFVVNDGHLGECLSTESGVDVFSSIPRLIEKFFSEVILVDDKFDLLESSLRHHLESYNFDDYVCTDEGIITHDFLQEVGYGPILETDKFHFIKDFKLVSARWFDDDSISAEISFSSQEFLSYASHYFSVKEFIDNGRKLNNDSMNGEGICDVDEEFYLKLKCSILLSLPELEKDFSKIVTAVNSKNKSLSLEVEPTRIEVLGPVIPD